VKEMNKKKNILKYSLVGFLIFSMIFSVFAMLISAIQSV
jgi:hypothetical protein